MSKKLFKTRTYTSCHRGGFQLFEHLENPAKEQAVTLKPKGRLHQKLEYTWKLCNCMRERYKIIRVCSSFWLTYQVQSPSVPSWALSWNLHPSTSPAAIWRIHSTLLTTAAHSHARWKVRLSSSSSTHVCTSSPPHELLKSANWLKAERREWERAKKTCLVADGRLKSPSMQRITAMISPEGIKI